jgi:hypothetical protein
LFLSREFTEEQEVSDLFVPKGTGFSMSPGNVYEINAPVIEFPFHGNRFPVRYGVSLDAADPGYSRKDPGPVGITQSPFDAIVSELLRINHIVGPDITA